MHSLTLYTVISRGGAAAVWEPKCNPSRKAPSSSTPDRCRRRDCERSDLVSPSFFYLRPLLFVTTNQSSMSCGGGGGNGNGRERRELGKSAMNTPLNCYLFKFLTVVHVVVELTLLTGNFMQRHGRHQYLLYLRGPLTNFDDLK